MSASNSFSLQYRILGSDTPDAPVAFVVHGILGSGRNILSFANRLQKACPNWKFVILDLRNHGNSQNAPPGDDLDSVSQDLVYMAQQLGEPQAIIAHSYGGKVAIRYAQKNIQTDLSLWILDTCPSQSYINFDNPQDNVVLTVLRALANATPPPKTRQETIQILVNAGLAEPVAMWLATNLKKTEHGLDWVFDRERIKAMIADYYAFDAWPFFEEGGGDHQIHFVRGEQSNRFTDDEIDRLELLHQMGAIELHTLEGAGHWVHIDKPDQLLEWIVEDLGR